VAIHRPLFTLGWGPSSVHDARRWAVEACREIDRSDLAECAELGVSELIGNAILHGEPPVRMRMRGTHEHPRIEVRDGSRRPPQLPEAHTRHPIDDPLITFGRGLDIVARCATAWGADVDEDGKVVWFVPSTETLAEGSGGVISGDLDHLEGEPANNVHVEVREVPLRTLHASQTQWSELRREVRLLSLAHADDYPLAKSLSDLFADLEGVLRDGIPGDEIESALASGESTTDLRVDVPKASEEMIEQFLDQLDRADEFCQEQRLLSLARTKEQRRFQRWLFGEFVRQQRGEPPQPWPELHVVRDRAG
jgi:hypothetical protein